MKVTFILKDLSDQFYNGFGTTVIGLNNLTDADKYTHLSKLAQDGALKITCKIGNGSFRDRVELNQLTRTQPSPKSYALESRKGYKLVTFEF